MEGHHTFTGTKSFGAEMHSTGDFEYKRTYEDKGWFEWTLRTEHDEDAYKDWDNLWMEIEEVVEDAVNGDWKYHAEAGYGGHNLGMGSGFELPLDYTEEAAKKYGEDQEFGWVDWYAYSDISPGIAKTVGYSAETATVKYPHQVFNSTSKAHAEKVAHLVPQSIVQKYDAPFGWRVMSKTPHKEARGYFLPWLRENDYFRTNQFLSEVQYEAETDKAADWAVDKEYLIGGGNSILTHDDVCPSCKEGRMETGNDSYGVQYLGCSKCGYGDSTPMSDLNCSRNWKTSSLEHDWVPYSYECKACGLIAPYIQNVMNSAESFNADTFHSFRNTRKTRRPFATARINPMPKIDEEVACMNCLWGGKDTELVSLTDEYGAFKGCPNCHSDNLIDLTREQKYAEDREESERMTRPEAEALADKVEKLVAPYVDRVEVCGSYRRGSPRPGDLDVIIIPKKGITLPDMVKAINPSAVNWIGEKKTQVIIDGRKVDFRVSSPKGWGAALLYFTGPAGYNIGMRVRAKKMGMKLNEYGIFDRNTNAYLGGATEDEIYTVLGKTPKLPAMRAEGVLESCSQCGATGELVEIPTRLGHKKPFCGPVCLYKWEDRTRLAAEEVFEAPRADYTTATQAAWEKSYDVRAKKPLTKFNKERMGGRKPRDDSKRYTYNQPDATGVSPHEAKLIQGYATVMKMCASRFDHTNSFSDVTAYKNVKGPADAYATSWNPKNNLGLYLYQAVTDLHALAPLDDKEKTAYMAKNAKEFKEERLPLMREFLRYYDITMTGPYKDIRMVATDRAPYSTYGGYGNVHYSRRNPYEGLQNYSLVTDVFEYKKAEKKLTIGNDSYGDSAAIFTRMTKMRPYTERPNITDSDDAYVEYATDGGDGGYGRRWTQGSQEFVLTPLILRSPSDSPVRNPTPHSNYGGAGWRWDVKDWETRTSAPYRYATMVAIPNGEDLQMHYVRKTLQRQEIVDTINACAPLIKISVKEQADARAAKEEKEEKLSAVRAKNQAHTALEEISDSMVALMKTQVVEARNAGVSEAEIYETLEMTEYALAKLVNDWEPSDYMAETGRNHLGS